MNVAEFLGWAEKQHDRIETALKKTYTDEIAEAMTNQVREFVDALKLVEEEPPGTPANAREFLKGSPWAWKNPEMKCISGINVARISDFGVGGFCRRYNQDTHIRKKAIHAMIFGNFKKGRNIIGSYRTGCSRVLMECLMQDHLRGFASVLARLAVLKSKEESGENKGYTLREINSVKLPIKNGEEGKLRRDSIKQYGGIGSAQLLARKANVGGRDKWLYSMLDMEYLVWAPLMPYMVDFDWFENWKEAYSGR